MEFFEVPHSNGHGAVQTAMVVQTAKAVHTAIAAEMAMASVGFVFSQRFVDWFDRATNARHEGKHTIHIDLRALSDKVGAIWLTLSAWQQNLRTYGTPKISPERCLNEKHVHKVK